MHKRTLAMDNRQINGQMDNKIIVKCDYDKCSNRLTDWGTNGKDGQQQTSQVERDGHTNRETDGHADKGDK
jgi:hypothetical protein